MKKFVIAEITKQDLVAAGIVNTDFSDEVMERLADKLGNDYMEQLYHQSLRIIAEIQLGAEFWEDVKEWMLGCFEKLDHYEELDYDSAKATIKSLPNNLNNYEITDGGKAIIARAFDTLIQGMMHSDFKADRFRVISYKDAFFKTVKIEY